MSKLKHILSLLVISLVMYGCKPTQHLSEGELLLTKVTLDVNGKIDEDELNSIIKQHPNRKILGGIRFHLGIFNMVDKEKLSIKTIKKKEKLDKKNAVRADQSASTNRTFLPD